MTVSIAQTARQKIYTAYLTSNMALWEQALAELEAKWKQSNDPGTLFELATDTYGLVGICVAKKCGREEALIAKTDGYLNEIFKKYPGSAWGLGIQGGLYGMKIAISKASAVYWGPKSTTALENAVKYDPNCPYGWVERGNAKFHSPAIVGGDKYEAIRCYKKAIEAFDKQANDRTQNWVYLHSLAWLGKAYEATGQNALAVQAYERAVVYEPGFTWVKDELLPALKRRL
jgi:tetratricopeptide (TPR) repeat protein